MPAFLIEFDANHGPERRLFTLDSYRPLRPQVIQVLEELRLDGRVIDGGAEDELAVYWNGLELEQELTPEILGVTTARPLQLRMRPRREAPVAEAAPETPADWLAILRPPLEGALGALLAWFATILFADVLTPLRSANDVDVAVTVLLVAGIALALALGRILRREVGAAAMLLRLAFAPLAALGTVLAVAIVRPEPTTGSFLGARVLAWGMTLALLAVIVGARRRDVVGRYPLLTMTFGLITGVTAALVMTLPGPSLIWQALAFLLAGLGVGTAAFGYPGWVDFERRRVEASA